MIFVVFDFDRDGVDATGSVVWWRRCCWVVLLAGVGGGVEVGPILAALGNGGGDWRKGLNWLGRVGGGGEGDVWRVNPCRH